MHGQQRAVVVITLVWSTLVSRFPYRGLCAVLAHGRRLGWKGVASDWPCMGLAREWIRLNGWVVLQQPFGQRHGRHLIA